MKLQTLFSILLLAVFAVPVGVQAQDATETTEETATEDASPRKQATQLISEGELGKASEIVEAMEKAGEETLQLRRSLVSAYSRKRDYSNVAEQYEAMLKAEIGKDQPNVQNVASHISLLRVYIGRTDRVDEFPGMMEAALKVAKTQADVSEPSSALEGLMRLRQTKAQFLMSAKENEAALAILRDSYQQAEELLGNHEESDSAARIFSLTAMGLLPALTDSEEATEVFMKHQTVASRLANADNATMAVAYVRAALSRARSLTGAQEFDAAEKVYADATAFIEKYEDNEKISPGIQNFERSISRALSSLESARKLIEMIGQPAPPFATDVNWVNADEPVSTEGKVVLLDFWALWCGPCIRTFPHLKHLTEEYGGDKFQIVGVTRYYNYEWDEEAGRAVRKGAGTEIDPAAENEVLAKFLASHDLTHPTMVVSKESTMHKDYGVSGIPHVALLDQQGNVVLVKVGSGEQNAVAIEGKIRELLGLSEATEEKTGEE